MRKGIAVFIAASVLSLAPASALAKDNTPKKKLAPAVHVCKKDDSSVNALACNMIKEAGGEGERGMLAVAFVTLNRKSNRDLFPPTVQKVVYQRSQFSWSSGKNLTIRDRRLWERAREISKNIIFLENIPALYRKLDPTCGSLYFHKETINPYWSRHYLKTVTIGGHIFYKGHDDQKGGVRKGHRD